MVVFGNLICVTFLQNDDREKLTEVFRRHVRRDEAVLW